MAGAEEEEKELAHAAGDRADSPERHEASWRALWRELADDPSLARYRDRHFPSSASGLWAAFDRAGES